MERERDLSCFPRASRLNLFVTHFRVSTLPKCSVRHEIGQLFIARYVDEENKQTDVVEKIVALRYALPGLLLADRIRDGHRIRSQIRSRAFVCPIRFLRPPADPSQFNVEDTMNKSIARRFLRLARKCEPKETARARDCVFRLRP